ncbi:Uncharacterised protein (plasmid) [Mesomycoplasma conjunctivae]|nr:Uncharacterised protein [Mesomycoplasma conjunctivae]
MKTKKIWLKTILPTITLPIVTALTATSCNWFAFPINPPKPSKNPTIKRKMQKVLVIKSYFCQKIYKTRN